MMYETDIFVKFKFRFIGMPIFITNDAQIVLTYHIQKGHKLIPGAFNEMNFLTLSDVKRATSVNSYTKFWLLLTAPPNLKNVIFRAMTVRPW
jgi:hypothetical protein